MIILILHLSYLICVPTNIWYSVQQKKFSNQYKARHACTCMHTMYYVIDFDMLLTVTITKEKLINSPFTKFSIIRVTIAADSHLQLN